MSTAVPLLYFMVAVMTDEEAPSAGMLVGLATRVMEPTPLASNEMVVLVVMVP